MPDVELATAFAAARSICRRHARSFYFASVFLPNRKRNAAYAVYAYCRLIDDAIDMDDASIEATDARHAPGNFEMRLAVFRDRLDDIYAGRLALPALKERSETHNALLAFARTVHEFEIPKQHFLDLVEGCRMDLSISRYETWASLESYCYHVAGVVGLIMCCVFGLTQDDAKAQAVQMGNAMQLTNILRDIKEDSDRGRVYLPLVDLARFGYSENDLAAGIVNDAFRELMHFEIARARSMFEQGAGGLCQLAGDGSRLTASTMAVIYAGILTAIERQHYDVFTSRAYLSTSQKLRRLPRAWRLARRRSHELVPPVFR